MSNETVREVAMRHTANIYAAAASHGLTYANEDMIATAEAIKAYLTGDDSGA